MLKKVLMETPFPNRDFPLFRRLLLCGAFAVLVRPTDAFAAEDMPNKEIVCTRVEKSIPHDAIINLGGDCQVAYQLAMNGLRKYALPFDALITPYESLRGLLRHEFEGFMIAENFELQEDEKGNKYILDKRYGARLIHDFRRDEKFLEDYEKVSSKYRRRIERLFHLIRTADHPLFVRKRITKEQATELKHLLSVMRNGKPFLLVVLDDGEEIASDWHIEAVRNFYLKQPEPYSWKGDSEAWNLIFVQLGLETSSVPKINLLSVAALYSQAAE